MHYFILIICSIRWDTAGRYFPKVQHQLWATPDTHLLMDQAFVLVKWSFIRIVIKYLNMNIWTFHFKVYRANKWSDKIKSHFLYRFVFPLTVGKFKSSHDNSLTRDFKKFSFFIWIELLSVHNGYWNYSSALLSDPYYFGGGVGFSILGLILSHNEPQIQMSQELCSALSLLLYL